MLTRAFKGNMNDVCGSRYRALMLLLLRAYEVTMAAKTTSWKFGPRQGRRRVTNGWLRSCEKKQNKYTEHDTDFDPASPSDEFNCEKKQNKV